MVLTLKLWQVIVSEKTTWLFIAGTDDRGLTGFGEATANHHIAEIIAQFNNAIDIAARCDLGISAKLAQIRCQIPGKAGNAIASACEQALLDIQSQRGDQPLFALLGGHYRRTIPAYANINRGCISRTPEEFATRALSAVEMGYKAIKFAPFDGLQPIGLTSGESPALFAAGMARIAAVAAAVGGQARIQIDCHARLHPADLDQLVDALLAHGVGWLEEPITETPENYARLAEVSRQLAPLECRFAGAEQSETLAQFAAFIQNRCYDVVMPDIILAGGLSEALAVGRLAAQFDIAVSPHNPCGPILDVMSAHLAAATPIVESMERQIAESPLYEEIITSAHQFHDGYYHLADTAGSGVQLVLDHPAIQQIRQAKLPI